MDESTRSWANRSRRTFDPPSTTGPTNSVTVLGAWFVPPGFAVVIATLGVSVLILVFGEIVPKSYGLGHAQFWGLRVALPISYVQRALGPLVALFDTVTRWITTLTGGDQHIEYPYLDD